MNKILVLVFVSLLMVSCKEPKGYVALSGKIENTDSKELIISNKEFNKKITLNDDGTFKDTLKVEKGLYTLTNGQNRTILFLSNGYNLTINADANDFSKLSFEGNGKSSNDYIAEKIKLSQSDLSNPKSYFLLEREAFDARLTELKTSIKSIPTENVDSLIIAQISSDDNRLIDYLEKNYEVKHAELIKFAKGKPSPKFTNYENYNGGTTSLEDLKGKYVYIDVWATWCGPCKQQIPFLKEIEKEYEHSNIAFVSISTDRQNKYNAWKKMIVDYEMSGIQLFAGTDYSFQQEYQINSIPRFILLDTEGNIVDADAPRPSDPRLKELLNTLNI
ncbi:TlpA family protein disulfide reductase [Urechidicola croceus]|uniref:Thioredoxin domain-containing protein n=1 Tax=Urechidicola croceus TaxID=1850246 RepID=A0A1D8P680_9FLAO|nr:TlpA disulfide reductase family protein [Urechidicola croceus]AOW20080.1 hypothetical protein LPB138_05025 [Urechidicola croceus]